MEKERPVHFKICCIQSIEEAFMAIRYGATAIGLVSEMPSGPGVISESTISRIAEAVENRVDTFLLTSRTSVGEIIKQHQHCRTSTIQLVDRLKDDSLADLKMRLPDTDIVQVVHVRGEGSINDAVEHSCFADAILLDSGNPDLEVKKLGGTGNTHNWTISKRIVESVDKPVYLAGGLNPENVVKAIKKVNPYGIDICSGLRTNGNLDENRLSLFVDQLKGHDLPHL